VNDPNPNQKTASEHSHHEGCLCCEVLDHLHECFHVSPAAREHLANSRIEFLKAIRGVIDSRIERLSHSGPRGAKIAVE
jgi:hypothetical protein